jgi:hypothetical protein
MNRALLSWAAALAVGVAWIAAPRPLRSQEPAGPPLSAVECLSALKAANAALIAQQEKTMQKLEDLKQKAEQVRIMTKRS